MAFDFGGAFEGVEGVGVVRCAIERAALPDAQGERGAAAGVGAGPAELCVVS